MPAGMQLAEAGLGSQCAWLVKVAATLNIHKMKIYSTECLPNSSTEQ